MNRKREDFSAQARARAAYSAPRLTFEQRRPTLNADHRSHGHDITVAITRNQGHKRDNTQGGHAIDFQLDIDHDRQRSPNRHGDLELFIEQGADELSQYKEKCRALQRKVLKLLDGERGKRFDELLLQNQVYAEEIQRLKVIISSELVNRASEEVANFKEIIKKRDERIKELETQLRYKEEDVQRKIDEISCKDEKMKDLKEMHEKNIKEWELQSEGLESKLHESDRRIRDLEAQLNVKEHNIRESILRKDNEIATQRIAYTNAVAEISELKAEKDKHKQESAAKVASLEKQLYESNFQKDRLVAEKNNLQEQLAASSNQLQLLKEKVQTQERSSIEFERRNREYTATAEADRRKKEVAEKDLEYERSENQRKITQISNLERQCVEKDGLIRRQEQKAENLMKDIESLKARYQEAEEQRLSLEREIVILKNKISSLESDKRSAEHKTSVLNQQLKEDQEIIARMNADIVERQKEAQEAPKRLESNFGVEKKQLQTDIGLANAELKQLREFTSNQTTTIAELREEISSLRSILDRTKVELEIVTKDREIHIKKMDEFKKVFDNDLASLKQQAEQQVRTASFLEEITALKVENQKLTLEVKELQNHKSQLQIESQVHQENANKYSERVRIAEKESERLRSDLPQIRLTIESLTKENLRLNEDKKHLQKEHDEEFRKSAALSDELTEMQSEAENLRREFGKLNLLIESKDKELSRLKRDLESYHKGQKDLIQKQTAPGYAPGGHQPSQPSSPNQIKHVCEPLERLHFATVMSTSTSVSAPLGNYNQYESHSPRESINSSEDHRHTPECRYHMNHDHNHSRRTTAHAGDSDGDCEASSEQD